MTFRVEVLEALRDEGLTVVEVNGWRTRGYPSSGDPSGGFDPHGAVNHHTGGAATGWAPSLSTIVNGRGGADPVPGPLAHCLQSRQPDANGLDVVYLIAAGRANHAGAGGYAGLAGNSTVWGLEVEHTGDPTEPFPAGRRETSMRVQAAFARVSGYTADHLCQHYEWTDRKVDFVRALLDPNAFRSSVAARLSTGRNSRKVLAWI